MDYTKRRQGAIAVITLAPNVEVHPDDAKAVGLTDGALARVMTTRAEAVAVAKLSDRQRRGSLFMPMHWTNAFAPVGRANTLVAPMTDPTSGQPEFKHTPARIGAYRETWRGFFLVREPALIIDPDLVWRRIPRDACHQHEFAGRGDPSQRASLRKRLVRGLTGEIVAPVIEVPQACAPGRILDGLALFDAQPCGGDAALCVDQREVCR